MRQINFNRIKLLWLRIAAVQRKPLTFSALGLFFGMLCYNLGTTLRTDIYMSTMVIVYYIIFCLYMSISLASTFKCMQSKEERIDFLTLPATQLEKFIACSLWAAVVPILIFLASAILNDLLIAIMMLCRNNTANIQDHLFFGILWQNTNAFIINGQQGIINGYPALLSWHLCGFSVYLLGACLWYKRVFLKTIIAIGLISFLLSLILTGIVRILPEETWQHNAVRYYDFKVFSSFANPSFVAIHLLLSVGMWWIGYRLFKRKEAISQKVKWLGFFKN